MKIGIDSYCFHRYFGEIYPGLQTDPGVRWSMQEEFLEFALAQHVDEVALESCFFDALDDGLCAEIKARIDEAGVDRVLGWGHPEGLWGGTKPEELEALKRHIPQTAKLGSTRMRITAASMNYAKAPREELIGAVVPMLREAAAVAAGARRHARAREPHRLHLGRDGADPRRGRLRAPEGQLRHRQHDPALRGPGRGGGAARAVHDLDPHEGHRHPRQGRGPLGELHLVAVLPDRRGRDRHAGRRRARSAAAASTAASRSRSTSSASSGPPRARRRSSPAASRISARSSLRRRRREEETAMTLRPAPSDEREPVGFGLLGYGFMGKAHANALRTIPYMFWPSSGRPELVAVAGRTEEKVREAATRFGYASWSTDWRDVVADERVDVFDDVGPDALHVEPVLAAIEHGKHVVCEKPLASTAADALRLYEAAEAAGVKHATCFNYRFFPAVRLAWELVHGGELGELHQARFRYSQEWRTDPAAELPSPTGVLDIVGSHAIDQARFLCGEIASVSAAIGAIAETRSFRGGPAETDDTVSMLARLESGLVVTIDASLVSPGRRNHLAWELNGSRGSARLEPRGAERAPRPPARRRPPRRLHRGDRLRGRPSADRAVVADRPRARLGARPRQHARALRRGGCGRHAGRAVRRHLPRRPPRGAGRRGDGARGGDARVGRGRARARPRGERRSAMIRLGASTYLWASPFTDEALHLAGMSASWASASSRSVSRSLTV